MLLDTDLCNEFMDMTQKYKQRQKKKKLNYIQLKSFCTVEETVNKMQRQPMKLEKTSVSHRSDKGLMGGGGLLSQSCPILWDPIDCSPPGSSVHGNFQTRILEWVAISFSRGSSQPSNQTQVSCIGQQILHHCIPLKTRHQGLSWWLGGKQSACQCRRHGSIPGLGRSHVLLSPMSVWPNY